MKLFIFEDLDDVSENYHSGGGVVIVADSLADAVEVAKQDSNVKLDQPPTAEYELAGHYRKQLFVFKNAGCC